MRFRTVNIISTSYAESESKIRCRNVLNVVNIVVCIIDRTILLNSLKRTKWPSEILHRANLQLLSIIRTSHSKTIYYNNFAGNFRIAKHLSEINKLVIKWIRLLYWVCFWKLIRLVIVVKQWLFSLQRAKLKNNIS
jgi:hypothetical protein